MATEHRGTRGKKTGRGRRTGRREHLLPPPDSGAQDTTHGPFFDALTESLDAAVAAARAANDLGHRLSVGLIDQAQAGQRDASALARQWADAPLDVAGLAGSFVRVWFEAQRRGLEGARQWWTEVMEGEAPEAFRRTLHANRMTAEAAVNTARGLFAGAAQGLYRPW